jgi:chromosome segregation ATPase
MDAISFVLGVKSRHLRSHKLGDLVFRADGKAVPAKRRASVQLVYELDDGEVKGRKVLLRFFLSLFSLFFVFSFF